MQNSNQMPPHINPRDHVNSFKPKNYREKIMQKLTILRYDIEDYAKKNPQAAELFANTFVTLMSVIQKLEYFSGALTGVGLAAKIAVDEAGKLAASAITSDPILQEEFADTSKIVTLVGLSLVNLKSTKKLVTTITKKTLRKISKNMKGVFTQKPKPKVSTQNSNTKTSTQNTNTNTSTQNSNTKTSTQNSNTKTSTQKSETSNSGTETNVTYSRSDPEYYDNYKTVKKNIKDSGLSGRGKGFEAHHLLEKQFAEELGLNSDEIIAMPLTPNNHRGKMGTNIDYLIKKELISIGKNFKGLSRAEQIWQAHRNVYQRMGYNDWAQAVHKAYFQGRGIKF